MRSQEVSTTRRRAWGGEPRRWTKCWPKPEVAPETMAYLRVVCLLARNFLILKIVVMSLKKRHIIVPFDT